MIGWFDVAYATLKLIVIVYCFREYLSSRKKTFQLFSLGFTCLIISDFVWVFAVLPWLNSLLAVYGYIRFGLYAAFTLLIIRALQLLDSHDN